MDHYIYVDPTTTLFCVLAYVARASNEALFRVQGELVSSPRPCAHQVCWAIQLT